MELLLTKSKLNSFMVAEKTYKINFMTSVHGQFYLDCVVPYIFFSLLTEPESHVEIILHDRAAVDSFVQKYQKDLKAVAKYNSNFLIRETTIERNNFLVNSLRFFEAPKIQAKYTYITDIDIMILDKCVDLYEEFWPSGLCYNNIIRPGTSHRLSGVHMCRTQEFYSDKFLSLQKSTPKTNADENILGYMCKKIHGLPPKEHAFRPVLGVHFSSNRGPGKILPSVVLERYKELFIDVSKQYDDLFRLDVFKKLLANLHNMKVNPTPVDWPRCWTVTPHHGSIRN